MKKYRQRGITLIELLIVIVIIAILAAILYPNFTSSVRKSKRSDAVKSIQEISHRLEKFYTFCNAYTEQMGMTLDDCSGLGLSATDTTDSIPSELSFYNIDVNAINCTTVSSVTTCLGYEIDATATGPQTDDTECRVFRLTSTGAKSSTNEGGNPSDCWT